MKNASIYTSIIFLIVAIVIFTVSAFQSAPKIKSDFQNYETCKSIGDWSLAQKDHKLYLSDPKKYKQFRKLYVDKDGSVCKTLKK